MRVRISTHGKKKPGRGGNRAEKVAVGDKINQQVGNDQDGDGPGLLRKRTLKAAQRDRENSHSKQNEKLKKH